MKYFVLILIFYSGIKAFGQFTTIPTGTSASIVDMAIDGDTLLISGYPNFFAKYYIGSESLDEINCPGPFDYLNSNLQIRDGNYYCLSAQTDGYDHNYILRSSDFCQTWDTLSDIPGLFYTMSIIDSTFGIIGGGFGSNATTHGNDTSWLLNDSLIGTITASATFDDSTVFIATTSGSYISYNRGNNWDFLSFSGNNPHKCYILNADTIYVVKNTGTGAPKSFIESSLDSGNTWIEHKFGYNSQTTMYDFFSRIYDMEVRNDGSIYLLNYVTQSNFNSNGVFVDKMGVFVSKDFGNTWTHYVSDFTEEFYSIVFLNDSLAYLGGENGLLLEWDLTVPITDVLGIENNTSKQINVYPNPSRDVLSFDFPMSDLSQIEVFTLDGQLVLSTNYFKNQIDISNLSPGEYVISFISQGEIYQSKFVKL